MRTLQAMAREIFELTKMSWMLQQQAPAGDAGHLSDQEFLVLDALEQRGTTIVGDLQRYLGVLPAQMSRIIRAMESRPEPTIQCSINPQDKRKINVNLTDAGRKAVDGYRQVKLARIIEGLSDLAPADREEFMRILDLMREGMMRRMQTQDQGE
jgi:DNA-binding MarR family transcriptional regulator